MTVCTCKKPDCRRAAGLLGEKKKPGRKRLADEAELQRPRDDDPCMPKPYIIEQIDEIWGQRRGPPASPALPACSVY